MRDWFFKQTKPVKIFILVIVLGLGWFFVTLFIGKKSVAQQYQTAQVEQTTLVVSISASGQVASTNNAAVSTEASGVVKKVYVKDGDKVSTGDTIAEIDLDLVGKQRFMQALASYQSAKNTLESAKANLFSLQSDMFTKWKTYMDTAQSGQYQNGDGSPRVNERQLPQFMSTSDDWLATEAKYKNQQGVMTQAQTALNSSWYSYQQATPTIYAPISGTITGLSLREGTVIVAQTNSTTGNQSSQKVASVTTGAQPAISVNLSQIDISRVKIGNKVTITLDAFPGKTYTGKVVSIDTIGIVSSGVTNYPATIELDTRQEGIYPNMSSQANIISETKENVLTVPISAVHNQNGQSTVQVLKNNESQDMMVEIGLTSDTQVEIISGLSEGDVVITSTTVNTSSTSRGNQSVSPFGAFGGGGFRAGGFGGGGGQGRRVD